MEATVEELKTLLANLKSAKAGLKKAAVESAKETLKKEVDKVENKNIYEAGNADGTYTNASWAAFKKAYEAAKAPSDGATVEELETLLTKSSECKSRSEKKQKAKQNRLKNQPRNQPRHSLLKKTEAPQKANKTVRKNVTYRVLDAKEKKQQLLLALKVKREKRYFCDHCKNREDQRCYL